MRSICLANQNAVANHQSERSCRPPIMEAVTDRNLDFFHLWSSILEEEGKERGKEKRVERERTIYKNMLHGQTGWDVLPKVCKFIQADIQTQVPA